MNAPLPLLAGLLASSALLSSCFSLERADGIEPGSISGVAVDVAGNAIVARVVVDDRHTAGRTGTDGAFVLRQLIPAVHQVRLGVDIDGDGLDELAAAVAVRVPVAGGVILGDVVLDGAARVDGVVVDDGAVVGDVRIVVVRDDIDDGDVRSFPVDGEDRSDVAGAFSVRGLARGAVRVFAVADDGRTSDVVDLELRPGDNALVAPLSLSTSPVTRDVRLSLVSPAVEDVTVTAFASGVERGVPVVDETASIEVSASLAAGVYDFEAVSARHAGVLLGQVVVPGAGIQRIGVLALVGGDDVCGAVDVGSDLDGDGVVAATDPACAAVCATAFGNDAGNDGRCDVDGEVFDCDDDGDGQPDVTEPPSCRTLCAGGDRDGDGVCDAFDEFPRCADNDVVTCDRDAPFVPPGVFDGGEGEGEGEGEDPCEVDVVIDSDDDADIAAVAGCARVRSVTVTGSVTSLAGLAGLSDLDRLRVANCAALTSVSMPALANADVVEIVDNTALQTIALPGLVAVDTMTVERQFALSSVGLGALGEATSVGFADNSRDAPLQIDLSSLRAVSALRFSRNGFNTTPQTVAVDLSALTRFDSLAILGPGNTERSTTAITLGAVTDCGDIDATAPHDFIGTNPATVCGDVSASAGGNPVGFDLDILVGVERVSSLRFVSEGVRDLTRLASLREVDGDLRIAQSVFTVDVSALAQVRRIGGTLELRSTQQTSWSFAALESVGAIEITSQGIRALDFPILAAVDRLAFTNVAFSAIATPVFPLVSVLPGGLLVSGGSGALDNVLPALTGLGTSLQLIDNDLDDTVVAATIADVDFAAFTGAIAWRDLPSVSTLSPLSSLIGVRSLSLTLLPAITDLTPLSGLQVVEDLAIEDTGILQPEAEAFATASNAATTSIQRNGLF